MSRTITTKETNQLFDFCRKHYVQHYDLQVELVDHLASAIEEQWQENPQLEFETALKYSFSKFGIYGFSKIKEQKQKELARKYNRLLWQYFMDFYRWPKMLMTLAITLALFTVLKLVDSIAWVLVPYFAFLVISGTIYSFFISPKKIKFHTLGNKKFMLIEHMKSLQLTVAVISQLPISMYNLSRDFGIFSLHQPWALLLISFCIISFNIVLWGYFFYIPEKVKQHFIQQFPEFAL